MYNYKQKSFKKGKIKGVNMLSANKKKIEKYISKTKIYLVLIAILILIICILEIRMIPVGILLYTLIILYTVWSNKKRTAELSQQLRDLTLDVNNTAKTTLINSPFPLVMCETTGNIIWKSEKFVTEFSETNIEDRLNEILSEIKLTIENSENKQKGNINIETKISNKDYTILGSFVKSKKDEEYTTILYFIDSTYTKNLKQKVADDDLCVGIIMIDN